jgi:hypothetical protein
MTARRILFEAILAGIADLRRRADLLDRINVFPVVDADTGTNMLRTAEALADAIGRGEPDLSRAVLLGARGNSGVILAQFLVGVLDRLGADDAFDPTGLETALARGRDLAYRAVAAPVEGTILTVMTDLSALLAAAGGVRDLAGHAVLERDLAAAVARTPELMPRLAEAGVVDAGALGFHVLACGLTLALPWLTGDQRAEAAVRDRLAGRSGAPLAGIADRIDPAFLAAATREGSGFRYCVDVVIELDGPVPADLASRFAGVGGSIDAVTREGLIKLHVHADDPAAVRRTAAAIGRVSRCEAADMTLGLLRAGDDALAVAPCRVRILGDSAMSLGRETAALLGIPRFENYVDVHGRMVRDGDLDRDELFRRMREGHIYKTAQASAAEVRDLLACELARSDRLVYLAVGRAYTGTQDLVRRVVAEHPERERIAMVDTRAASGQQGVAVLATARHAAAGAGPGSVAAFAEAQAASAREYLVLDTLAYLSRTGRVGRVKAALAGALGVRPIVGHGGDGAVTRGKVRSHADALDFIAERLAAHPGTGPLLVLLEHTDNRAWLDEVRARLAAGLPADTEFVVAPLSSTSSVHMGPGTWGVAVTRT